jgi:hypothetical protein
MDHAPVAHASARVEVEVVATLPQQRLDGEPSE